VTRPPPTLTCGRCGVEVRLQQVQPPRGWGRATLQECVVEPHDIAGEVSYLRVLPPVDLCPSCLRGIAMHLECL
jgi:hypothetical protein